MSMLASPEICYGCGACNNICPKNCIEMKINEYGELRPSVDLQSCIKCGQCTKVCPALKQPALSRPLSVTVLAIADDNLRKGCASGGAAKLFYEHAVKKGAAVFGCDFDQNYILRMRSAFNVKDTVGFQNSKYTFCRMGQCYNEIKSLLQKNIPVLFIGTSCQVYALKCFLGGTPDGLTTVDLICHGVPPEKYFLEYLNHYNAKFNQKIDDIKFRGNNRSNDYRLQFFLQGKCMYDVYAREEPFFAGYVNYIMFEEKCYHCPFSKEERVSDISIGDWWGPGSPNIGKLSLVLVNSAQGQTFLNNILGQPGVFSQAHTLQDAINYNEQLRGAFPIPDQYFEMREYYKENGFLATSRKYIQPYIKSYKRKKRTEKAKQFLQLPFRVFNKLKRMVVKN